MQWSMLDGSAVLKLDLDATVLQIALHMSISDTIVATSLCLRFLHYRSRATTKRSRLATSGQDPATQFVRVDHSSKTLGSGCRAYKKVRDANRLARRVCYLHLGPNLAFHVLANVSRAIRTCMCVDTGVSICSNAASTT